MGCDRVGDITAVRIARHCRSLTSLHVSSGMISPEGIQKIVRGCSGLTAMNLMGFSFAPEILSIIAQAPQRWKGLAFGRSWTVTGHLEVNRQIVESIAKWPHLTSLRLRAINIPGEALRRLGRHCPGLTRLSIRRSKVVLMEDAVSTLVRGCTRLQILKLSAVELTPVMLKGIGRHLWKLSKLQFLDSTVAVSTGKETRAAFKRLRSTLLFLKNSPISSDLQRQLDL